VAVARCVVGWGGDPIGNLGPVATSVRDIHTWWAWVVVLSNGAVGLWALGAHWWAALRHRGLWWCVVAAEASIVVQAVLGVWMIAAQGIEAPAIHVFYGFVAVVALVVIYGYRFQVLAWQYLLYGFGSLFLMGLGIRSMFLT